MMRIYSYVVREDNGLAPNPFWDYCTLALGEPLIRQVVKLGDWIVGLKEKSKQLEDHSLLFAFKVSEKLSIEDYWNDERFQLKKPDFSENERIYHIGDNIFELTTKGFTQHHSLHSNEFIKDDKEWKKQRDEDLQGKFVLISEKYEFYYFGDKPEPLPSSDLIDILYCDIGHKCIADPIVPEEFVDFIHKLHEQKKIGLISKPEIWPKDDDSWEECLIKK